MSHGKWRSLSITVFSETEHLENPRVTARVYEFDGDEQVAEHKIVTDVEFGWFPGDKRDTAEQFASQAFGAAIVIMHNREAREMHKASLNAVVRDIPRQRL